MTTHTTAIKSDIGNRRDIAQLVDTFYDRVRADDLLGPIFDEVARVDWDEHLPLMYDFWDSVLFSTGRYHGNPLEAHRTVANMVPFTDRAFFRWLTLFESTIDQLFAGPVADRARESARRIAHALQERLREGVPRSPLPYRRSGLWPRPGSAASEGESPRAAG